MPTDRQTSQKATICRSTASSGSQLSAPSYAKLCAKSSTSSSIPFSIACARYRRRMMMRKDALHTPIRHASSCTDLFTSRARRTGGGTFCVIHRCSHGSWAGPRTPILESSHWTRFSWSIRRKSWTTRCTRMGITLVTWSSISSSISTHRTFKRCSCITSPQSPCISVTFLAMWCLLARWLPTCMTWLTSLVACPKASTASCFRTRVPSYSSCAWSHGSSLASTACRRWSGSYSPGLYTRSSSRSTSRLYSWRECSWARCVRCTFSGSQCSLKFSAATSLRARHTIAKMRCTMIRRRRRQAVHHRRRPGEGKLTKSSESMKALIGWSKPRNYLAMLMWD